MNKKKLIRYSLLALLALLITAFVFVGNYTDRLIDPYVRSLLEETKPMNHLIEYEKIRVSLLKRIIFVKDVKMFPDTSLEEGRVRYEIEVGEIMLTEFRIAKMLFHKSLDIQDIRIDRPDVRVILPEKRKDEVDDIKDKQGPGPMKQMLRQIYLDRIVIYEGNFKLYHRGKLLASSDHINFYARSINLAVDSQDKAIGYTYGDVNLNLKYLDLFSGSGLYDMKLDYFEASKKDSSMVLEGFELVPKYNKKEFSDHLEYQTDRFDLNIGRIKVAGIGLQQWLTGQPLRIASVHVDSLDADIYRDKNVPFDVNHFPLFYNESFLKVNVPLHIDSLLIDNSRILYGELVAEHPVAGTILLEDFRLRSYDLANHVAGDPLENVMHFQINARVMGEGNLNLDLVMPLEGQLRKFECSGSVGAMQLSPLNDMLQPSINMKFNSGHVDRMTFAFKANDNYSYGWMEFLYSDVNVELLKKDPDKQWGFVSRLANAVAVSRNPGKDNEMKSVEIGYERNKNKGIINYVWKTIQSGMVRTILPTNKYTINRKTDKK